MILTHETAEQEIINHRKMVLELTGKPSTDKRFCQIEYSTLELFFKLENQPAHARLIYDLLVINSESNNIVRHLALSDIAKSIGCSIDSVRRSIRFLEIHHFLQVHPNQNKNTIYVLNSADVWREHHRLKSTALFYHPRVSD